MNIPFFKKSKQEARASVESPSTSITGDHTLHIFGLDVQMDGLPTVTIESALGVPAIFAAVNFISSTLAGLPLDLYGRKDDERIKLSTPLACLLHDAVNDEMSSFDWRKMLFEHVFTRGRGVSFIEKTPAGKIINLWPLDPNYLTIRRLNGRKEYIYRDGDRGVTYKASEVIDLTFMLREDGLGARSPIFTNKTVVAQAIALTEYGSKFFKNGGVPPFAIEGPFESPGGMQRGADDVAAAVKKASKDNRLALALPKGHTIKQLGVDPEKAQMIEARRLMIEEIARMFSLPPVFLQDLTHGTFSNTEQQDLHYVKHTVKRWVEAFEQELNLKLFKRGQKSKFVELNVDGLLRGDFASRTAGYATSIQSAVMTPNEARKKENRPSMEGGDQLLIQSATVPLAGQNAQPQIKPNKQDDDDEK